MSYRRVDAAMRIKGVPTSEKLVLIALASFENDVTGLCNPSQSTIAEMVGMSREWVCKRISNLISKHKSIEQIHNGRSSSYRFLFPKTGTSDVNECSQRDVNDASHKQGSTIGKINQEKKSTKSCPCSCSCITTDCSTPVARERSIVRQDETHNRTCGSSLQQVQEKGQDFDFLKIPSKKEIYDYLKANHVTIRNKRIFDEKYTHAVKTGGLTENGERIRNMFAYFSGIAQKAPEDEFATAERIKIERWSNQMMDESIIDQLMYA